MLAPAAGALAYRVRAGYRPTSPIRRRRRRRGAGAGLLAVRLWPLQCDSGVGGTIRGIPSPPSPGVVNRFNGSACECSANYTGVFCNLRPGEIAEKEEEEEEEELVPRWLLLRPSSWSAEGTQSPVDASA